jgi:hypothetical protein
LGADQGAIAEEQGQRARSLDIRAPQTVLKRTSTGLGDSASRDRRATPAGLRSRTNECSAGWERREGVLPNGMGWEWSVSYPMGRVFVLRIAVVEAQEKVSARLRRGRGSARDRSVMTSRTVCTTRGSKMESTPRFGVPSAARAKTQPGRW